MLTAWAIAALAGPQIATMILDITPSAPPNVSPTLSTLFIVLAGMFIVQLVFLLLFARTCKKNPPTHEVEPVEA